MAYARKEERTLGELISDLSDETRQLVRKEMQLASNEMNLKVQRAVTDFRSIAIGGGVAYAGVLAIIGGIVLLLGLFIPLWLSALIVGALVAGIGYYLVKKSVADMKGIGMAPHETIESLKENERWLKRKAS